MKTLITAEEIASRVEELGAELSAVPTNGPLAVLGVMTGGLVFCADLIRAIDQPIQLGVLHARSYDGTQSGDLTIWTETLPDLADRDVLIVDDIFDTGKTLARVATQVRDMKPRSVRSVVLLEKQVPHQTDYRPDWVAFEIPDEFVVGYGLDYNSDFRQLPDIRVYDPAAT